MHGTTVKMGGGKKFVIVLVLVNWAITQRGVVIPY